MTIKFIKPKIKKIKPIKFISSTNENEKKNKLITPKIQQVCQVMGS